MISLRDFMLGIGLCLGLSTSAFGKVLFLDLNDASDEVRSCKASAGSGEVRVINRASNGDRPVRAEAIEAVIAEMERKGEVIDSVVISGHDGSGEFFGGKGDQNYFTADEFKAILGRNPATQASLKQVMSWGCYTGTVAGNENYWLNLSPNVVTTVAFPLQAPNKNVKRSQSLLGQMCAPEARRELQAQKSRDEFCALAKRLPLLHANWASICSQKWMATRAYTNGRPACLDLADLEAQCLNYDADGQQRAVFDCYFTAADPLCANPPVDGDDDSSQSELRQIYDQNHLYWHCAEPLANREGFTLPYPPTTLRLVKYHQIKNNLNRLNRTQLDEYDRAMKALGYGELALGDLSVLSRAEINSRLNQAVAALAADRGQRGGYSVRVVGIMAQGIKNTLVDLNYALQTPKGDLRECSHISLIHEGARDPRRASQCIFSYQEASQL